MRYRDPMNTNVPKKTLLQAVNTSDKPSKEEAMEAVRTLIRWAGDNPEREGLKDTQNESLMHTANGFEDTTWTLNLSSLEYLKTYQAMMTWYF